MNRPDVPLYKLDFTGESPFNLIKREYGNVIGKSQIFIPQVAPFYINSVKLFHPDGSPMFLDEDYEFYGILGRLTEHTAKPVGLFIRMLKDTNVEYFIEYQTVGNFNKITEEILNMLRSISQDDRPVEWNNIDNKPLWFVPEIHQHDYMFHFFGFMDLANQLTRLNEMHDLFGGGGLAITMEAFQDRFDSYIAEYKRILVQLISSHNSSKVDPHGVWKDQIGLDKVDNFKTADLAQTLEMLREDLHITPGNAVKAVDLIKANNERLSPSGTLPLFRYGTDGYIPPKIDGSFEGMGGSRQAIAAVVENDNTLMVIQGRNNGTTRGLYYFRCQRWESDRPVWEETGYRYSHPTATADGATLDAVANGSNQYIMIVGDSKANIWYWCETFGTLNPSRHVLRRITGAWVPGWADNVDGRLYVLADENYKEFFAVARTLNGPTIKSLYRPDHPVITGDRSLDGMRFYPCFGMASIGGEVIVDYPVPEIKNFMDPVFTPHQQVLDAQGRVTQGVFKPTVPIQSFWYYHSAFPVMKKMKDKGPDGKSRWGFTLDYRAYYRSADSQYDGSLPVIWRGYFTATDGAQATFKFTPGPGEKLYTLNPVNLGSSPDWADFNKYKMYPIMLSSGFYTGNAIIGKLNRLCVIPTNQSTPPCNYRIEEDKNYETGELLINPPNTTYFTEISSIIRDERNPVGQGIGFQYQYIGVTDSDDYRSGAIFARQQTTDPTVVGRTEWLARAAPLFGSNWHGDTSTIKPITLGGKSVMTFPLTPKSYKVDLGPAIVMTLLGDQITTRPNRRETWKNIFGADAYTRLDGKLGPTTRDLGDGLLMAENNIKTVGGVVKYIPTKVYNVAKAILAKAPAELAKVGMTTTNLSRAWTLVRVWDDNNQPLFILVITDTFIGAGGNPQVRGTYAPIRLVPVGSPTVVNGYDYYDNVNITFIQPFVAPVAGMVNARPVTPRGGGGFTESSVTTFTTQATPSASPTGFFVLLSTYHRYDLVGDTRGFDLFVEFNVDWTTKRIKETSLSNTTYSSYAIDPFHGFGHVNGHASLTQGAGIVTDPLPPKNGTYYMDVILNHTIGPTPNLGMSNLLQGGYTIYFKEIDNVLIGGKKYSIPATYIDLFDIDPNPANKQFYVYLRFINGVATYEIEDSPSPENSVSGCVALVETGPVQIDRITPYNRFTMNGIQISPNRRGSTVLVTTGTVYAGGRANLKPGDFLPG